MISQTNVLDAEEFEFSPFRELYRHRLFVPFCLMIAIISLIISCSLYLLRDVLKRFESNVHRVT